MKSYFETRFKYDYKKDDYWKVICHYLQQFIPKDAKVLDFGAGYCHFINNVAAVEKHAIDIDEIVARYAGNNVIVHMGDLKELKYDEYFDVIFSSNVLEHLGMEEIFTVLNVFKRMLNKNGILILLLPNFKYSYSVYFDDYTHRTILTDKSVKDILSSCGFDVILLKPKFLPFSTHSKLPKATFLLKLYLLSPWKPFAGQMLIVSKKK